MILFLEDWKRYPNAIVHNTTKNKTFIDYVYLLREMKVENHAFPLALHNPLLRNIDPHDPNLEPIHHRMIIKECKENPWYFFREVLVAPSNAGIGGNPFRANRGNITTIWLFFNHITTLLIQPRQTGKSFVTESIDAAILNIWGINMKLNLLTKDEKLRSESIARIKNIMSEFPKYLQFRTKKDSNNSETIDIKLLNNKLTAHVAQSSKKLAFNAARGLTSAYLRVDEFAYYNLINVTLPAALPSLGAAKEDAKKNNQPYGVLLTTTAGWLNSESGKYAYKFYSEATVWDEKMLDLKDRKQLRKFLRSNGSSDKENVVVDMNHLQLGFTDKWLKERILEAECTEDEANTDFLGIWADGDATSPFDKKLLKRLADSITPPFETKIYEEGYALRWYIDPDKAGNREMVLASDTSDAVGNDDITIVIRDIKTAEVLAVGEYNETNTIMFAEWIFKLLNIHKRMILIMERRSSGTSIIDYLFRAFSAIKVNPYTRIFNWIVQEAEVNGARFREMKLLGGTRTFQDKHRKENGFATAASGRASRDKLYGSSLTASMKNTAPKVLDKKLVGQLLLLKIRNNRIDHAVGEKDDLVISWLLGYWFCSNAENVEFYGYSQNEMLSKAAYNNITSTVSQEDITEANLLTEEIRTMTIAMETTDNKVRQEIYLGIIKELESQLPKETQMELNLNNAILKIEQSNNVKGLEVDDILW